MSNDTSFARLDVEILDGVYHVRLRSGVPCPIRMCSIPVRSFVAGWHPMLVVDLGIDLFLLEFRSNSGLRATWFLDSGMNQIGDRFDQLTGLHRDRLLDCMFPYLDAVYRDVLASPAPRPPAGASVVALVSESTIEGIVTVLLPRIAAGLRLQSPRAEQTADDGPIHRESLTANLQDCFDQALVQRKLRWPSPLDGTIQHGADSIPVHEHRMGFRFRDSATGLVFYVGATFHIWFASDIFIPAQQRVLLDLPADLSGRSDHWRIAAEYLTHAATHAVLICDYLGRDARVPSVVMRGYPAMHMGHHVWNELTALDRLQRVLATVDLPRVVVPDAEDGSEPFAPVEAILPAFHGHVDRDYSIRRETLGSYAYRNAMLLMRVLDERVSTQLAGRIRHASALQQGARQAAIAARDLRERGYRIVTLGVRVENRTAVDLVGTLHAIIDHLAERLGRIVIVLDGHNARIGDDPTTCFSSHGQPEHLNPLLLEYELVVRLRRRYQHSDVEIVNAIGVSASQSVVWCDASDGFVAFWGAGLAKYRWICNKPGLVLSSRFNLADRHDRFIYSAPAFQQDPAPMLFLDPNCVIDRPDAGVYFCVANPLPDSYANFDIDPFGLRQHLDRLVEMLPRT